jgi:uncharacterized protein (TIGR03437 family)
VIISGADFNGATAVRFGVRNASFTVDSPTRITATLPLGAVGTVDVTVTTPLGTSATASAAQFTYMAAITLINTGFEEEDFRSLFSVPISGDRGEWSPTSFGECPSLSAPHGGSVMMALNSCNTAPGEQTLLVLITPFTIPEGDENVQLNFWMYRDDANPALTDRVQAGVITEEMDLLDVGTPELRHSPVNGWVRASKDLSAYKGQTVYIALVGISEGGGNIYVDDLSVDVSYAPRITGISPSGGPVAGGTLVTISGANLAGATAVNFGAAATSFTIDSDSQISALSPAGVAGQTVDITVATTVGVSATGSADQFTYSRNQARNMTTGTTYPALATAIANALTGEVVRSYDSQCEGTYVIERGISLMGGYDDSLFQNKSSTPTTLKGSLTVTNGAASAETLLMKGLLSVKEGGSLKVKWVTVQPLP